MAAPQILLTRHLAADPMNRAVLLTDPQRMAAVAADLVPADASLRTGLRAVAESGAGRMLLVEQHPGPEVIAHAIQRVISWGASEDAARRSISLLEGALFGRSQRPSPPPPAPPLRPRGPIVLGSIVGIIVLAIVGAAVLRPPSSTTTEQSSATSGVRSPSAMASRTPPGGDDLGVTCWNGKAVDAIERCGRATGTDGLKYIYPSLVDQWEHCEYVDYRSTTATYDCQFDTGIIRYRYWRDPAEARRHYLKKYADAKVADFRLDSQLVGVRYRATSRDKKGILSMTAHWGAGHYSLSVDAKTGAEQDGLWRTVRIRAPVDLRGFRSDEMPREAKIA